MREMGGYLQLDRGVKPAYHKGAVALNSARNAVAYLKMAKTIKKLYLPYYLCASVFETCEREGIEYEFYHVDSKFLPVFDKELKDGEYLYVVNYFGQVSKKEIIKLKKRFNNIIVDNVQAFYEKAIKGIDTIYSCRKFFGVPDGAYLACDLKGVQLEEDFSAERMKHVLGMVEGKTASANYKDFQQNEELIDKLPLRSMSKLTETILSTIDYKLIEKKRFENWKVLEKALKDKNKLELTTTKGPYCYPFYCENGAKKRKELAALGIFVPTLWPNVLEYVGCDLEKDYVKNILPLPCDQRYTKEDMKMLVKILLNESVL
jgi:hypothetical protein